MTIKSPKSRAGLILKKWTSELPNKDRTLEKVRENFDELWGEMYTASVDFDTAYSAFDDAVKAHMPTMNTVRFVLKSMKWNTMTDKEFFDSWSQKIKAIASESFYYYYPLEEQIEQKKIAPSPTIGGIPREEYNRQRKYIEQFPLVTSEEIREIERKRQEEMAKMDGELLSLEELLRQEGLLDD